MDVRRLRFAAALLAFLAWVAALGAMAIHSARRPGDRPGAVLPP
jgi:hypothetical protein